MQTVDPMAVITPQRPTRVFTGSLAISAVRCTLSYLIFPFVLPLVGITAGLDAGAGMVLGPIAIAANVYSLRRFRSSNHKYRIAACVVNATFIVLLSILLVGDVWTVLG